MSGIKMEAEIFFDSYLPEALLLAQNYAADDGFVASMPQLLHARANADYGNILWNTWFTSNSEESQVNTPQGNEALVTVHGGGIFASPERFRKLYHSSTDRDFETAYTGLFAGKITEKEASDVLAGKLPDGSEIPVYAFAEFKRGIADLPRRYAVVMDFDMAQQSISGYEPFDELKDDPLMIVRAGGVEAASAYLDKVKGRHKAAVMGSFHLYNKTEYRRPGEPQTTIPLLSGNSGGVGSDKNDDKIRGLDSDFGLRSGDSMVHVARYVAVAPRNAKTDVRDLPFGI